MHQKIPMTFKVQQVVDFLEHFSLLCVSLMKGFMVSVLHQRAVAVTSNAATYILRVPFILGEM